MKKPWLAGLLNVIPGLGYLYVDGDRVFGRLLVLADALLALGIAYSPTTATASSTSDNTAFTIWDWMIFVGLLAILVAFIVDANFAAKQANQKLEQADGLYHSGLHRRAR